MAGAAALDVLSLIQADLLGNPVVVILSKGSEESGKQDARIPFEVKGSEADIVFSTFIWKPVIISTSCTCSTRMSRKT
jgi:hypothetical protein